MKLNILIFLLAAAAHSVFAQCTLVPYEKGTEHDTIQAAVLIGPSFLIKQQNTHGSLASTLDDTPDDPRVTPAFSFLWYANIRPPRIDPYLFNLQFESTFSIPTTECYASVLLGKEYENAMYSFGLTGGTTTIRVASRSGSFVTSSELGYYKVIPRFGPKCAIVRNGFRLEAKALYDIFGEYSTGALSIDKSFWESKRGNTFFVGLKSAEYAGIVVTATFLRCLVQVETYPALTDFPDLGKRTETIMNARVAFRVN